MPQFTIIIPTYNSCQTIQKCIDSILCQSFADFEIIIQDGLSKDETVEKINGNNDSRIKIFSEKDHGVYDAMNRAVEKSSGEWVLFLGSDDLLINKNVLEEVSQHLDRNTADLFYGNAKIVGSNEWAKDGEIYKGEISLPQLFENNFSHQSIFYNRRIFKEGNRYKLKYPVCADYDFNLYCAAKYKTKYIPVIVSLFYTGGLSSIKSDQNFARDKWINIVSYFKKRLLDKRFIQYRNVFKKTWKTFIKRSQFGMALLSIKIYLYYKIK